MDKNEDKRSRVPKAAHMRTISKKKYVEDEELKDTPARLFRQLLNKMDMNPFKWANYLRDFLEWMVPMVGDREKVKADRTTRAGNIKDTYFQKDTLTFNKLLEGLSILRMTSCEIIIRTKDENGNIIEVSEVINVMGNDRGLPTPIVEEPPTD